MATEDRDVFNQKLAGEKFNTLRDQRKIGVACMSQAHDGSTRIDREMHAALVYMRKRKVEV